VYWRGLAPIFLVTLHFTSSRLVLRVVYWRGLAPIFPVILRFSSSRLVLRVVYWRGLAPILPVWLRFTGSRLGLRVVYWRGIAPILPVMLHFTSSQLVLHVVYWRGIALKLPVMLRFDEDIATNDTSTPTLVFTSTTPLGPITRARARWLTHQVSSLLSSGSSYLEYGATCTLFLLRNNGLDQKGRGIAQNGFGLQDRHDLWRPPRLHPDSV
jgi:hypothetical protein